MGNLRGTDLNNQGKEPVLTSLFEAGMPQNGGEGGWGSVVVNALRY